MSVIERYVIVITAYDGTVSVCGTFSSEYRATVAANKIETMESGLTANVHQIESTASVLADIAAACGTITKAAQ